jgi:hypothetical protein
VELLFALGLSTHIGFASTYNEIHPHIRLKQDNQIYGAYINSEENLSLYGGFRYEYRQLGFEAVIVSGYDALSPIIPMVRSTYDYSERLRISIAPSAEKLNSNINFGIVTTLEINF